MGAWHDYVTKPHTQPEKPLYGIRGPRWYVRWRGFRWLRHGLCPCCYSSPPKKECPICEGNYGYSYLLTPEEWLLWWSRWAVYSL